MQDRSIASCKFALYPHDFFAALEGRIDSRFTVCSAMQEKKPPAAVPRAVRRYSGIGSVIGFACTQACPYHVSSSKPVLPGR